MKYILFCLGVLMCLFDVRADGHVDYSITNRIYSYGTVYEVGNSYSTVKLISPVEASGAITNGSAIFKYDYRVEWNVVGTTSPLNAYSQDDYELVHVGVNSNDAKMVIYPVRLDENGDAFFSGDINIPNILADESGYCEVRWCSNDPFGGKGHVKMSPCSFDAVSAVTVPRGWEFPLVNYDSTMECVTTRGSWNYPAIPWATSGEVRIPSEIDGYKVTRLDSFSFVGCENATSFVIPDTVKHICSWAFMSCNGITSITIPRNVTSIQEYAIYACGNLTNISVDVRNRYYSTVDGALYDKTINRLMCVPPGKAGVFAVPSTVRSISDGAFMSCYNLTFIDMAYGVEEIGDHAFCACYGLKKLTIPSSVVSISEIAFDKWHDELETVFVDAGDGGRVAKMLASAGINTANVEFVEIATDVLPALENPTAEQVKAVLSAAEDERLAEEIVDGEGYSGFCEWSSRVKNVNGDLAGASEVMSSKNAWQSYALDLGVLLGTTIADGNLEVKTFDAVVGGRFECVIDVKDVVVGSGASEQNIRKVIGLAGSDVLELSSFSPQAIDLVSASVDNGSVRLAAEPTNVNARTFFIKPIVR